MRGFWVMLGVVVLAVAAWADGTATGVQWPGWRVSTSEYPDAPGYPITNMLDGSPRTAWVFHKPWQGLGPGVSVDRADAERNFNHGIGATIYIFTDHYPQGGSFTVDGIGLINGYAKSAAIYRRNNRITKLTLFGYGTSRLEKTVTLRETQALQRISFPRQQVGYLMLRIDGVAVGADDDLCISELVLYDHGKPIPWKLTPTVLYNRSNDCGCGGGPEYSLVTHDGTVVRWEGRPCNQFIGVAHQPGTARLLLCTQQAAYYYDMAAGIPRLQRALDGRCVSLGWIDPHHALISAEGKDGIIHWYRLNGDTYAWETIPAPPKDPTYLPGVHQPNYGE